MISHSTSTPSLLTPVWFIVDIWDYSRTHSVYYHPWVPSTLYSIFAANKISHNFLQDLDSEFYDIPGSCFFLSHTDSHPIYSWPLFSHQDLSDYLCLYQNKTINFCQDLPPHILPWTGLSHISWKLSKNSDIPPHSRLIQEGTSCILVWFSLFTWPHSTQVMSNHEADATCIPSSPSSLLKFTLSDLEQTKEVQMHRSHYKITNAMQFQARVLSPKYTSPEELFFNENYLN